MTVFQDVFISYGRADSKAFVIHLKECLKETGLTVWFDFDDIPLATDFQDSIDNGIERSHTFLYVISPSSVNSPYCDKELQLALRYGKRIIPLMHVESIDRDTWQQRHPNGTDADWQTFQAANQHRSYDNLNKTVSKLNWVFFRTEDDFEQSLSGLLALFPAHQDYVQQHTHLLIQALTWERNHRQTRYLLVGDERQAAERWLMTRFVDEMPPCTATPLHCEFIVEAIKNANNLMTQVFLCHDDQDQESAEQIRQSLMRQGITVWNYRTDIQTSQNYHDAIARGVEEADNIIFILSPHSAQSTYCQRELDKALSLNKRVIPVLAQPTDLGLMPAGLTSLQYVNLTDNLQASDYIADESQLLKLLKSEAAYFTEHKTWLTQALKWERQQQNPTMLLRGYNLRRAEAWLKAARTHEHPPTELHHQFITESLRQPPDMALDVFVSYSRVDSEFARRLNEALQVQGKRTWFDQDSIATGTDFQQEIYRGIERSDVFLFVLSPQSVASPYCADEVEYANNLHKRVVTVLHRPVDPENLHPVLAKIQWLDFRDHDGDFQINFQDLLSTLDTDREHLATHTRLLGGALEWDRRGRDESLLLRGQNLEAAASWLTNSAAVEPKPTGLQQEFVRAGQAREETAAAAEMKLRRGALLGAAAAAMGIFLAAGASIYAWVRIVAADKLLEGASWEQAGLSAVNRLQYDQIGALLAAIKTGQELTAEVTQFDFGSVTSYPAASPLLALQQSKVSFAQHLLAHQDGVASADFSPDGSQVVTASFDGTARVWNLNTRQSNLLRGHQGKLLGASFSPNGQQVVTASSDTTARVWNLKTGKVTPLIGHQGDVLDARFSPDGSQVVTVSSDTTARLWNLNTGKSTSLEGHQNIVWSARFSPDGSQMVTVSFDKTARLWNLNTGASTPLEGHQDIVWSARFSPDGNQVVTASSDKTARVWNLNTGESTPLVGHQRGVVNAYFSPNGSQVVTISSDRTARVWDLETGQSIPLAGHTDGLMQASFSSDGRYVVTASFDNTARLWNLETGDNIASLAGHEEGVVSANFSPDGSQVVTASLDGTARVWDFDTSKALPREGHQDRVVSASFSPQDSQVVTASDDGTARIWDLETGQSTVLNGHTDQVVSASFSPDGTQVVTASFDDTARIWDLNTRQSIVLTGHTDQVVSANFSPDGSQVVTASFDRTARVWSLEAEKAIPLEGYVRGSRSARFSPDGSQVVTASDDGIARVWDLATGEVTPLKGHSAIVRSARFSPDGSQVVTASSDGTARVWDLKTLKNTPLEGHKAIVWSARFSPDGRQVVTASDDGTARVWDLVTDKSIVLEGHEGGVKRANFSPDGRYVMTASSYGTARLWDLQGRQLAILPGFPATLSPDGQRVVTVLDGGVKGYDLLTLPQLLDWGCQWLHNYLAYGSATDADRELCNSPRRDHSPTPHADTVSLVPKHLW